jgi:hypothetical protein
MEHLLEGGLLIELADRVHQLISDEEFSNYLFVFGTVIAAQSIADAQKPWQLLDHDQVEYFNFSPVYMGGPDPVYKFLVTKKYISTADFLDRVNLPDPAQVSDLSHRHYDELPHDFVELLKHRNVKLVTNNMLEFDGLRIGLEICLDHRMGALWKSLKYKEDNLVDVQLIISAGMSIERGPNPIKPGGVVYLTDGEAASSATCIRTDTGQFEPEHVCREALEGVKHEPAGGPGYSNFIALSACVDVKAEYKGFYSMYQPQGCANTLSTYGIQVFDSYREYPPSLDIYPVIALP